MKQIRILLADDHNVMRGGLRLLLERQPGFKVVKEASDGRQAVEQAEATRPDIAVLDIAMPNLSGIEAAQRISALLPQTRIIILSMHRDESYVLRALKWSRMIRSQARRAHDAIDRRDRAFLHQAGEKRFMLVCQLARCTRRRFVDETVRPPAR